MDSVALLTTSNYSHSVGGISRYSYEQCRNVSRYSKNKFDIKRIIFSAKTLGFKQKLDDFSILHNLTEYPLVRKEGRHAVKLSTANEFQILLHPELSSDPITKKQKAEYPKRKQGLQDILKSDFIIANSMQTKKEAQSLDFDRSKIFVVNLGVDRRFTSKTAAHKGNRKKFVIGYIGALRRRKNLPFSFGALNGLDKNKYEFCFYGSVFPDFKRDLRVLLNRYKGAAFYRGIAPEKKIVGIYDGFDVFLVPSLYEGFGLGIIEAQARGLPVVIYKGGKIAEETRKYCIVADDQDHAAQIIDDLHADGYDEGSRKKAMQYARAFTWENTAKKTIEIYERILDQY